MRHLSHAEGTSQGEKLLTLNLIEPGGKQQQLIPREKWQGQGHLMYCCVLQCKNQIIIMKQNMADNRVLQSSLFVL